MSLIWCLKYMQWVIWIKMQQSNMSTIWERHVLSAPLLCIFFYCCSSNQAGFILRQKKLVEAYCPLREYVPTVPFIETQKKKRQELRNEWKKCYILKFTIDRIFIPIHMYATLFRMKCISLKIKLDLGIIFKFSQYMHRHL